LDILDVSHASLGGNHYIITFIDDHSRKLFVYLLQRKSDAFTRFQEFHALLERQTEGKLKVLHTDNGGEYISSTFSTYLAWHGIHHEWMTPYTPQQNARAEHINLSIANAICTMLIDSSLPWSLWGEAMETLHTSKIAAHTGPLVAMSQSVSGQPRCCTSRTFATTRWFLSQRSCRGLVPDLQEQLG
jgi:transposase InsO family protein